MGSKTFEGVRFAAYTDDHLPVHVHGFYGGAEVIIEIDLLSDKARLSKRRDGITPRNAKRSVVSRILRVADQHLDELYAIWEDARG